MYQRVAINLFSKDWLEFPRNNYSDIIFLSVNTRDKINEGIAGGNIRPTACDISKKEYNFIASSPDYIKVSERNDLHGIRSDILALQKADNQKEEKILIIQKDFLKIKRALEFMEFNLYKI